MRESMGEANMTVISIIMIGMILPVFTLVIPRILTGIKDKSCCLSNNGIVRGTICSVPTGYKVRKGKDNVSSRQEIYKDVRMDNFRANCE